MTSALDQHSVQADRKLFELCVQATRAVTQAELTKAEALISEIIEHRPDAVEAMFLSGLLRYSRGDTAAAVSLITMAHDSDPDIAPYATALGGLYFRIGQLADGNFYSKLSMSLAPHPVFSYLPLAGLDNLQRSLDEVENYTYMNKAVRAFDQENYRAAVEACGDEGIIGKDDASTAVLRGRSLLALGDVEEALPAFRFALWQSAEVQAMVWLAEARLARLDADAALTIAEEAAELASDPVPALAALADIAALRNRDLPQAARLRQDAWQDELPPPLEPLSRVGESRLRVGILTDALGTSEFAPFLDALLRHAPRNVDLLVYSVAVRETAETARLRVSGGQWTDLVDIDDETAATIVDADDVDVLIDATTHWSAQRPGLRLGVAAKGIGWLTHGHGIAGAGLDLLVDDAMTAAGGATAADALRRETLSGPLLRLDAPECDIDDDAPLLQNGAPLFGLSLDGRTLSPEALRQCARVLREVEGASLLLMPKHSEALRDVRWLMEPLADLGVSRRVIMPDSEGQGVDYGNSLLRAIDVLLEPTGTHPGLAAQALWRGVPVVSSRWDSRFRRFTASVLEAADCGEWVAATSADFVAAGQDALLSVSGPGGRRTLHDRVRGSALFRPADTVTALFDLCGRLAAV